jgi:TolB-like protein
VLEVTAGSFQYEPIVNQVSQTPAGVFNSQMMFLAEQLDRNLLSQHRGRKTLVTNMVDLNDVQQTNALGRMLSEHLMHELAVRLWAVVDVRANVGLILNETGEFLLTRNTTRGHTNHSDGMVVTGTYMTTTDGVLVNLKVLDAVTSQVLSTAQTRLESSVFLSRLAAKPLASKTMKISN